MHQSLTLVFNFVEVPGPVTTVSPYFLDEVDGMTLQQLAIVGTTENPRLSIWVFEVIFRMLCEVIIGF